MGNLARTSGIARGVDDRPVRADRVRKSIGAETTFTEDLHEAEPLKTALGPILDKVWRHCETNGISGRTVTLKAKYSDFVQVTRSRSQPAAITERAALELACHGLLEGLLPVRRRIRLLGVSLSSLNRLSKC